MCSEMARNKHAPSLGIRLRTRPREARYLSISASSLSCRASRDRHAQGVSRASLLVVAVVVVLPSSVSPRTRLAFSSTGLLTGVKLAPSLDAFFFLPMSRVCVGGLVMCRCFVWVDSRAHSRNRSCLRVSHSRVRQVTLGFRYDYRRNAVRRKGSDTHQIAERTMAAD